MISSVSFILAVNLSCILYKKVWLFDYSPWCVYRLLSELFCALYQLVELRVSCVSKSKSISKMCLKMWNATLCTLFCKIHWNQLNFLNLSCLWILFFANFQLFHQIQWIVNFLSNKNVILPRFAFVLRSTCILVIVWFYQRSPQGIFEAKLRA